MSFPEKAVLYYLRKHVKNVLANYREKAISPYELDIYLPDYRLAIEYDGIYGHSKEKGIQRDIRKNLVCKENRITLIRIREEGCPILNSSSVDLMIKGRNGLASAINDLFSYLTVNYGLNTMFDCNEVDLERDSGEIYSLIAFSEKENSILKQACQRDISVIKVADILKLWHAF